VSSHKGRGLAASHRCGNCPLAMVRSLNCLSCPSCYRPRLLHFGPRCYPGRGWEHGRRRNRLHRLRIFVVVDPPALQREHHYTLERRKYPLGTSQWPASNTRSVRVYFGGRLRRPELSERVCHCALERLERRKDSPGPSQWPPANGWGVGVCSRRIRLELTARACSHYALERRKCSLGPGQLPSTTDGRSAAPGV